MGLDVSLEGKNLKIEFSDFRPEAVGRFHLSVVGREK